MAHHTLKSGYDRLSERLNRFPQRAPPTKLLFKILKLSPVKRALAGKQLQSRYLERLLSRH